MENEEKGETAGQGARGGEEGALHGLRVFFLPRFFSSIIFSLLYVGLLGREPGVGGEGGGGGRVDEGEDVCLCVCVHILRSCSYVGILTGSMSFFLLFISRTRLQSFLP